MSVQAIVAQRPDPIALRDGTHSLPQPVPSPQEPVLTCHRARMLLDLCNARMKFFPSGLFADPAWDMLLDLTHARLSGKRISVSSLCIAAHVPATTALRRIGDLVANGLATRIRDENDGRRVFVELTEEGFERMNRYFEAALKSMSAETGLAPMKA